MTLSKEGNPTQTNKWHFMCNFWSKYQFMYVCGFIGTFQQKRYGWFLINTVILISNSEVVLVYHSYVIFAQNVSHFLIRANIKLCKLYFLEAYMAHWLLLLVECCWEYLGKTPHIVSWSCFDRSYLKKELWKRASSFGGEKFDWIYLTHTNGVSVVK